MAFERIVEIYFPCYDHLSAPIAKRNSGHLKQRIILCKTWQGFFFVIFDVFIGYKYFRSLGIKDLPHPLSFRLFDGIHLSCWFQ